MTAPLLWATFFWLGIGAAQKGAGSNKRTDRRHWVISIVVGILLALLIAAGSCWSVKNEVYAKPCCCKAWEAR
jgi:hypothetical protein